MEKDRGRSLVGSLPAARLPTETDGPFIEHDGHPIAPGDVGRAVELLSSVMEMDIEETQRLVVRNFAALVSPSATP